jgi:hypothetical protein
LTYFDFTYIIYISFVKNQIQGWNMTMAEIQTENVVEEKGVELSEEVKRARAEEEAKAEERLRKFREEEEKKALKEAELAAKAEEKQRKIREKLARDMEKHYARKAKLDAWKSERDAKRIARDLEDKRRDAEKREAERVYYTPDQLKDLLANRNPVLLDAGQSEKIEEAQA